MESALSRPARYGAAALAAAASGVLWAFGTGLHPVPYLTWLAVLPVLLAATRVPAPLAALAAGLGYLGGAAPMWHYYTVDILVPVPLAAGLLIVPAIVLALAVWLFRTLALRGRLIAAALSVPAIWVSLEYLVRLFAPHGAYWSLAYTQADLLPVVQTASVAGVWGVSFLLLAVPSAVAAALVPGRRYLAPAVLAALLLVLPLGLGALRLVTSDEPRGPKVASVALPGPHIEDDYDGPQGVQGVAGYLGALPGLAAAGAEIAVFPEKLFLVPEADAPGFLARWGAAAKDNRIGVVVGVHLGERGVVSNAAVYFPADGGEPVIYRKHHMIPGLEVDVAPGEGTELTPGDALAGFGSYALIICKDLDFPDLVARDRDTGAGVLLAPALDFDDDSWLHDRMAVFRGVEQGMSLVRTAELGEALVSDPYGEVWETDGTPLVRPVSVEPLWTVYSVLGDWFAWTALALSGLAVASLFRRS
ncbi:apolipoprotein N-acyltransferase [Actinorhabdospora filicis]|uniref:Apolipoprotein N-acyltransferase n=1 Tax=Actinorhabdospora filicis TaxID=1785913 RepID=A0A9W6SEJ8_9ACTN|nr:nitrilase-related carbon-nitrogen hydrolase [Actinorhabdospora filicis]GLZ75764.1 apolipoprotein N-acyltransferase [Actinorhabdospora filicis]